MSFPDLDDADIKNVVTAISAIVRMKISLFTLKKGTYACKFLRTEKSMCFFNQPYFIFQTIINDKNPVYCAHAEARATPSIFIPNPYTKAKLKTIFTMFTVIAINIGVLASCIPINQPLNVYMPNTAGAAQMYI